MARGKIPGLGRWGRPASIGLTILLCGWAGIVGLAIWQGAARRGELGFDAAFYADLGRHFLETGAMYYVAQLTGPYPAEGMVNLYPPLAMYLFVPFTALPRLLWWAIPLSILAVHAWSCRPAWWTWPILALLAGLVPTLAAVIYGNTILWSVAAIAVGFRLPAAAALLAFKPTDLVGAVVFFRRRSFWAGVLLVAVAAVVLWPHWFVWVDAMRNVEGSGLLRNVNGLPVLAIPMVIWVGRTRGREQAV